MNDYEQELIDDLEFAEEEFNIDQSAIKRFEREVRQKKTNIKKKINKVKIDLEEKE
jgi:hypothetical protein